MAREIDLDADSFTEEEIAYLKQRPWMVDSNDARLSGETAQDESNDSEGSSYEEMTVNDLRRELKSRDLDYSKAPKDELVARLEENDAEE